MDREAGGAQVNTDQPGSNRVDSTGQSQPAPQPYEDLLKDLDERHRLMCLAIKDKPTIYSRAADAIRKLLEGL